MIAWIGAAMIGVANGILREATYGKRIGERSANQLSALTAIVAFAAYFWRAAGCEEVMARAGR
jgi:hypothetical protein